MTVHFTLETQPISSETQRRDTDMPRRLTIEANDVEQAINSFADLEGSEVTSIVRPLAGEESIATVRKRDALYVVRVYRGA